MLWGLKEFLIKFTKWCEVCTNFQIKSEHVVEIAFLANQSYLKPTDHICHACKDFFLSNAPPQPNTSKTSIWNWPIIFRTSWCQISPSTKYTCSPLLRCLLLGLRCPWLSWSNISQPFTNISQTFHNFSQTSDKHFTNLGVLRCLLFGLRWPWLSWSRLDDSLSPRSTSSRNW